jgi:hypothetical protein
MDIGWSTITLSFRVRLFLTESIVINMLALLENLSVRLCRRQPFSFQLLALFIIFYGFFQSILEMSTPESFSFSASFFMDTPSPLLYSKASHFKWSFIQRSYSYASAEHNSSTVRLSVSSAMFWL